MGQLTQELSPWDLLPPLLGPATPLKQCTIQDIEAARAASPYWMFVIDVSPEWAAIRLARWDYDCDSSPKWDTCENFEVTRFNQIWRLFGRTWRMATPIADSRLRFTHVGHLTCRELDTLRNLLADSVNHVILVQTGDKISSSLDVWVAQHHRL
ncbi:hypothetical protein KC19_VG270600 [Ceratodon purpureus]|uniref:Uncharacterized protein n=1 Tax=Ceratodon purpureus TaxID=3225 RepID=A0A8T0HVR8_CERPU|nr:hypothetical protein KC19_VG270600 [Ceratodon purpureus]